MLTTYRKSSMIGQWSEPMTSERICASFIFGLSFSDTRK